ncbi:hypothetical protein BDD12DRAFT_338144 [Trichophaea hybrida]|nr:hypothetical protein BDD12DRAFT_338144 [Trichophaea hybrida]
MHSLLSGDDLLAVCFNPSLFGWETAKTTVRIRMHSTSCSAITCCLLQPRRQYASSVPVYALCCGQKKLSSTSLQLSLGIGTAPWAESISRFSGRMKRAVAGLLPNGKDLRHLYGNSVGAIKVAIENHAPSLECDLHTEVSSAPYLPTAARR